MMYKQFSIRKFGRTLKIAFTLVMARTFGIYQHSGWDGDIDYAKYKWRSKMYKFPTSAYDDLNGESEWGMRDAK